MFQGYEPIFLPTSRCVEMVVEMKFATECIHQWFSTGVPRHTRVPWRGPRGAAKYWIFSKFSFRALYFLGIYWDSLYEIYQQLASRVPQNISSPMKGAAKSFYSKRVPWTKKGWETLVYTYLGIWSISSVVPNNDTNVIKELLVRINTII